MSIQKDEKNRIILIISDTYTYAFIFILLSWNRASSHIQSLKYDLCLFSFFYGKIRVTR